MIHAYAINSLNGCEYYIKQCTCGYEEKNKKIHSEYKIGLNGQEFCPKCGTPLMSNSLNSLSLASIPQSSIVANLKTYNKACFFELELFEIDFITRIDFQKKKLKIDKRTIKNNMVKIIFDASQKPEDFIKYYNKDNKEISKEEFFNQIPEKAYILNNYDIIGNKFNLLTNYFTRYMNKNRIKSMISFLESKTDFFVTYEQIIKSNIDPYPIKNHIDLTKTNPIEMLGVRPFTFKYIRSQKTSINHSLLDAIKIMEEKIGDQTVNYLQTFGQKEECMNITFMNSILDLTCEADLSITKLHKYIYKEVPMKQFIINPVEIITLLRDSFEMSKQLGLVFNKNSKTLRRYHDELVEEYKTIEDQIIAKKFKKQMERKKYLEYEEKNNQYCIIVPNESKELIREGQELRHCVGSYIKRVAEGRSYIVFLRKKDTPDESYTTIEINSNDEIVQIRKKHNSLLTEKDAVDFVNNWAENKNLIYKVY